MSHAICARMTVFHLDDERGFRGGERQLLYLASALRADGHANVICCRADTPLEREARLQGFDVLVLPFAFEFDLGSAFRIVRAARHKPLPVIHAHTGHTVGIAAACRLLGGPPAIAHRRGASALRGGFSRWFKYDRVARVVAVSRAIEDILERGGLPRQHIAVVPDSIPVTAAEWRAAGYSSPRFAPASAERRAKARRLLAEAHGIDPASRWVGNLAALVPLKDHATLIAAAELVVHGRPDTVFVIAGEGPERDRLEADIKRRHLTGRVVLLGHCDAAELFAAIDVFVLSSTREGMGSVLLEAASCGIPVAATAVGGIPEVVHDGHTGLLVAPRDHTALADALTRLLTEPALVSRVTAAARDALPQFGLAAAVRRMEMIYGSAVAPRPAPMRRLVSRGIPAFVARSVVRAWPIAATVLLFAAGAAAALVSPLRQPAPSVQVAPPRLASSARRPAQHMAVRVGGRSGRGISFGGGFADLSDRDLLVILGAADSLVALPSAAPDPQHINVQAMLARPVVRSAGRASGL